MNEVIICQPSPVKTLAVSRFPLRELLNFLAYQQHPELLIERVRRQPVPVLEKFPSTVRELKEVLKAEKCDKNEKLFIDCNAKNNHIAVLLHNEGVQFWIHYFRCGIGLVNLSFFSHLASVEGSLTNGTRNITHSYEYQWFTHDLRPKFFNRKQSEIFVAELGDYFIKQVNPNLLCPYIIYFERRRLKEPYKFISGSLERLTEILIWTHFVCEGMKIEKNSADNTRFSPSVTITCGNLISEPKIEHPSETFINAVGALAIRENAPYMGLCGGFGRQDGGENYARMRRNKHQFYFNLRDKAKDALLREKIAARFHLVDWLNKQGEAGERIIKCWKLESN